MRIKLIIDHLPKQKLPINYQYLVSSWIYKTLHESDANFADWLHEQGYTLNGKKYKHFCFSNLKPTRFALDNASKTIELTESPTELIISFNINEGAKNMIKGLFQNNLIELNSGEYFKFLGMVNQVSLIKLPSFTEQMQYKAEMPICVSVGQENAKYSEYLHPTDERFAQAFVKNLTDKANAVIGKEKFTPEEVQFVLKTETPKSKLLKIKGVSIKGFLFDFELTAPPELQKIGYLAGFGTQNSSLGMGFCEEKETR